MELPNMSDLTTRRRFFAASAAVPLLAGSSAEAAPAPDARNPGDESISLNGPWQFRLDSDSPSAGWREVHVPHTWQVMDGLENYYGVAHYRRTFRAPAEAARLTVSMSSSLVPTTPMCGKVKVMICPA